MSAVRMPWRRTGFSVHSIIDHMKLGFIAEKPSSHVFAKVALMAAEEPREDKESDASQVVLYRIKNRAAMKTR